MNSAHGGLAPALPKCGVHMLLQRELDRRVNVELMRSILFEEGGWDCDTVFTECVGNSLFRGLWG